MTKVPVFRFQCSDLSFLKPETLEFGAWSLKLWSIKGGISPLFLEDVLRLQNFKHSD